MDWWLAVDCGSKGVWPNLEKVCQSGILCVRCGCLELYVLDLLCVGAVWGFSFLGFSWWQKANLASFGLCGLIGRFAGFTSFTMIGER